MISNELEKVNKKVEVYKALLQETNSSKFRGLYRKMLKALDQKKEGILLLDLVNGSIPLLEFRLEELKRKMKGKHNSRLDEATKKTARD